MRFRGCWLLLILFFIFLLLGSVVCIRHFHRFSLFDPDRQVAKVLPEYLQDEHWVSARRESEQTIMPLITRDRKTLQREIKAHTFYRGSTEKKLIALTFDDGPHPDCAPQLVALLQQFHIHATFFVVGTLALKNPQLVRQEYAAGNEIGNHTYHHIQPLKSIPEWEVATEIIADGEVIKSITGVAPHLFRPPGGGFNEGIGTVATALGYTTIMWTDDPGDFDASISTAILTDRLLQRVRNGAVILLHDGGTHTLALLPNLITTLQHRGYQFVTVDELIQQSRTNATASR